MNELKKPMGLLKDSYPEIYNTIKTEFGTDGVKVLDDWIEKQLNHARMDQDIINEKYILEKQDEIEKIARVKENEDHIKKLSLIHITYPNVIDSDRISAMREIFEKRISQLKGEK